MALRVQTQAPREPSWQRVSKYQQASSTRGISILTAAASLLLAHRAFYSGRLVEAAGQLSLALTWAQQLGLQRLGATHSFATARGNLAIEEQIHAGQLVWSGCAVLNHFLEAAGVASALIIHHPAYNTPPLLSDQIESLQAAFDPTADPETAITALSSLAGLHTLAYIVSETTEYVSKMRPSASDLEGTFFALERRLARWPGLVNATMLATLQCCDVSINQTESRGSANRECLSTMTALLDAQATLMINEKVPGWSLQRQMSSAKAATAIADLAASFANALDDTVRKVMLQPWCLTALFSGGVQNITGMTRAQRLQEMEDLREEIEVVRRTLQNHAKDCELASHYDDILKSVQLPRGPLGRANTTSSYDDGDTSRTGGSGQGGGGPDANDGGTGVGYGLGFGVSHRATANSTNSNPFYQSGTYPTTTGASNTTSDRNERHYSSRNQRQPQSSAPVPPSSDMDLEEYSSRPETPTPNPMDSTDHLYSLRVGQVAYGVSDSRSSASPATSRSHSRHDPDIASEENVAQRNQQQQNSGHVRFQDYPAGMSSSPAMPMHPNGSWTGSNPIRHQYDRHSAWGSSGQGEQLTPRNNISMRGDVSAEQGHYATSATLPSSSFENLLTMNQASPSVRSANRRTVQREQGQQFSFELPATISVNLFDSESHHDASSRRPVTAGRSEQSAVRGNRHSERLLASTSNGKDLRPSTSAERAPPSAHGSDPTATSYEPSTTLTATAPSLEIFADVAATVDAATVEMASVPTSSPASLSNREHLDTEVGKEAAEDVKEEGETGEGDNGGVSGQRETTDREMPPGDQSHRSTGSSMSTLREALGYPTPLESASSGANPAPSMASGTIFSDLPASASSHLTTSATTFSPSTATTASTGSDLFKVEHAPRGVLHL